MRAPFLDRLYYLKCLGLLLLVLCPRGAVAAYGYGYGYNNSTGKYEYFYGYHPSSCSDKKYSATVVVSGYLTSVDTGQPITGATITNSFGNVAVTTDGNGYYTFNVPATGHTCHATDFNINVCASSPFYVSKCVSNSTVIQARATSANMKTDFSLKSICMTSGIPNLPTSWANDLGMLGCIQQSGTNLSLSIGGQTSQGCFISASKFMAYGTTATFNASNNTITFPNGRVWSVPSSVPNYSGIWINDLGTVGAISQSGTNLGISMAGQNSAGCFAFPDSFSAYGITASLNGDINWANGRVWQRTSQVPNLSGNWINDLGTVGTIQQSGTMLAINMAAENSKGHFVTLSQVFAFGVTVAYNAGSNTLTFPNGRVWHSTSQVPNLSGSWKNNYGDIGSIQQSGTTLTLNIAGQTSQGYFTTVSKIFGWGSLTGMLNSSNNTINWSNGVIWDRQ